MGQFFEYLMKRAKSVAIEFYDVRVQIAAVSESLDVEKDVELVFRFILDVTEGGWSERSPLYLDKKTKHRLLETVDGAEWNALLLMAKMYSAWQKNIAECVLRWLVDWWLKFCAHDCIRKNIFNLWEGRRGRLRLLLRAWWDWIASRNRLKRGRLGRTAVNCVQK